MPINTLHQALALASAASTINENASSTPTAPAQSPKTDSAAPPKPTGHR